MFRRSSVWAFIALLALILFTLPYDSGRLSASYPHSAFYSAADDQLFWFLHTSDIHIGARGTQDSDNLRWLVTQARQIFAPSFIVVSGDLTDSTNGNLFGYPNGPYQAEWDEYKGIADPSGADPNNYYDLPGNHDQYNDGHFAYYLANSVQGRALHNTQVSWTKEYSFGKYHFLGINTADNTGSPFSLTWPYGDYAGLDSTELSFIDQQLSANRNADLSLIFGHHPLAPTGNSSDTYVYYGLQDFIGLMDQYTCLLYGYGHTHAFSEALFDKDMRMSEGVFYFNVASLGKSSQNQYTVMAIDCNGISSTTRTVGSWPVVLITAPLDRYLGGTLNPYSYLVPAASSNPVRALVFDPSNVSQVQYRIDGAAIWQPMAVAPGNARLYKASWDASALAQGEHTIEVKATDASARSGSDIIKVFVQSSEQPQAGVSRLLIGKYVTTGTKRNKVTVFQESGSFKAGETVVFRAYVEATGTASPVSGAMVNLSVAGSLGIELVSAASNSEGMAEAKWVTTAPGRKTSGTPTGNYTASVSGVSVVGFVWDGQKTLGSLSITN